MSPGVLITDGTERVALAAARSLVNAGYEVHVAAPKRLALASVSRGVRAHVLPRDASADPAAYMGEIERIVRNEDVRALIPLTDASVEAVLEGGSRLPHHVAVPFPDLAIYRRASDKHEMLELGRACGLAVPDTVVVRSVAESDAAARTAPYPAVVKPHRSLVTVAGRRQKFGVSFVADSASCRRALAALPAEAFPVLLQKRVTGSGEGLFALRWDGRLRAVFAHRRLREKPPAGGISVYRESIDAPPELLKAAERMLDALDWQGVAMIECKRESTTGRHVIMEVNGRFWGSLQLAIDAGVDFPALLVACAMGRPPEQRIDRYETGIRSRWFWGDVDHLYLRLRHSLDGGGSRLRAVLDFLKVRRGRDRNEIWRWRDPAPGVLETLQWFGVAR